MKKLFWGIFFIYLNFNLDLSGHQLNLLPDFVGYILLILGMQDLAGESAFFKKAKPFAIGMTVYSALVWVGALLGFAMEGVMFELLSLAALLVSLYISWLLICGILEMEAQQEADWGGKTLRSRWKLLLGVQIANRVLSLAATFSDLSILYVLVAAVSIAGMVCIILYLLAWYRLWNAYGAKAGEKNEETTENNEQ